MLGNDIRPFLSAAPKVIFQPKMWALYDQTVVSGCNFFTMVLLARALSLEAFGLVSLTYTLTLFLDNHQRAFFTQPLNVIGANELPLEQTRRVGALLAMHALWIPIALLFVSLSGYFFYPYPSLIAAVCFYVTASQLQEFFRRAWYTKGLAVKAFLNDAVSHVGQLGLLIILYITESLSPQTAFLAMGSCALGAASLNVLQGMPLCLTTTEQAKAYAIEHWEYGKWLVLGVFVIWGGTQLYPLMLSANGLAAVGALGACRSLLNGLSILMQAMNSYLPTHARKLLAHAGRDAFKAYFSKLGLQLVAAAGIFCLLVYLFSSQILLGAYGPKYLEVGQVMKILAGATFIQAVTSIPTNALISLGKTREIFIGNLAATLFSLSFGWLLVQHGGVTGAAIGILIALLLSLVVQLIGLHRALSCRGE